MRKAMYIDTRRCIGCNSCSMACKQENEGYGKWSFVIGGEEGIYPAPKVSVFAMLCMMCWNAPCKKKCDSLGYRAIVQRPDGIVYIDQNKCVGCRKCEDACKYKGVLNFNPTTKKEEKCHFCMHRIDRGELPACVVTCMGVTREFGDFGTLLAKYPNAKAMADDDNSISSIGVSVLYSGFGIDKEHSLATASYKGCIQCHD